MKGFKDMAARPVRSVTIAVAIVASVAAGRLCPCTQGCCEDGWFQYKDACYRPVDFSTTWRTAEDNCNEFHAHLASVHSDDEDNFIFHVMKKKDSYWLGAYKTQDRESPWDWTDNSAWDYNKLRERLSPRHHLLLYNHVIVDTLEGEGTTYWKFAPNMARHKYVCKYLLE